MSPKVEVPLTGAVLAWAIAESGFTMAELGASLNVPEPRLRSWIEESDRPTRTEFTKLAQRLRRPTAIFFLPEPPASTPVQTDFRAMAGASRTRLLPREARWLRRAHLLQELYGWVLEGLEVPRARLPHATPDGDPRRAAAEQREVLGISVAEQLSWSTPSQALEEWRRAVETLGVVTFELPMGSDGSRGFSLWDEAAPVLVLNKEGNNPASRAFTLLHEYGHLLHRRTAVCVGYVSIRPSRSAGRQLERWCDRFAAGVLMPETAFRERANVLSGELNLDRFTQLSHVRPLADAFRASMRATALRLIDLGLADESLYGVVNQLRTRRVSKGGGGTPRAELRVQQYGRRLLATLLDAQGADLIGTHELLRTLAVTSDELVTIQETVHASRAD